MRNSAGRNEGTVNAVLEGGPDGIPPEERLLKASVADEKIKIEYLGGYEHFARVEPDEFGADNEKVVFRWTTRTKIAE